MSVFHQRHPLYNPRHAKIHWSKRAYSNVDRHNNDADGSNLTEGVNLIPQTIPPQLDHTQFSFNTVQNHIRDKYDECFWEDTRVVFEIMEAIKNQVREVQESYGTFQRLQRTFVQAVQRSYATAFNHTGCYHITNISHVEGLLRDFTEHATDKRIISQFLSIIENLNQIRQSLWDLNLDSEEVRRMLRSLDRTVCKTAGLKLTTFSRPGSGAEAKRILTSRPQTPASRRGSRPVSAASAIYVNQSAPWQSQINDKLNRLGLIESESIVASLIAIIPMAVGLINDGIKTIEKVSYDQAYAAFKERSEPRNLVNFVHDRRGHLINRTGSRQGSRTGSRTGSRAGSRPASVQLEHNDKVIIPSKYQNSKFQERVVTPSKYRRNTDKENNFGVGYEPREPLEKYEPGDKVMIPSKYQQFTPYKHVPTSNVTFGQNFQQNEFGTQTANIQKSINKYLGYRPQMAARAAWKF